MNNSSNNQENKSSINIFLAITRLYHPYILAYEVTQQLNKKSRFCFRILNLFW